MRKTAITVIVMFACAYEQHGSTRRREERRSANRLRRGRACVKNAYRSVEAAERVCASLPVDSS